MRILLRDLEVGMRIWACLDEPPVPTEYTVTHVGARKRTALLLSVKNPHHGEVGIDPSDELFLDEKSCWLEYRTLLKENRLDAIADIEDKFNEAYRRCNERLIELAKLSEPT